jgi:HK97 family phage major capsid protein
MLYQRIDDLPQDVQTLSPAEAALWMNTYNRVFKQANDSMAATLAAWGAVEKLNYRAVRSVNGGDGVAGWALLFTDEDHLDLVDTYFSQATNLLIDYFPSSPLWYEHGFDLDYGPKPIGRRLSETIKVYGHGIWLGHSLHKTHPQYERTVGEARGGELSYSSDSIGHYVDLGFNLNGELREWPLAGCSLTKRPAEPALGKVALKSFVAAMDTLNENRPSRSFPTPNRGHRKGAGGAKDGSGEANEGEETNTDNVNNRGAKMNPEQIAQLAEFLGVENTVEAVRQGLEDLVVMLSEEASTDEAMTEIVNGARAVLIESFDLDEQAEDGEIADALRSIIDSLGEDEADENPLQLALRTARENGGTRSRTVPFRHNPTRWQQKNVNHNRGNARKPGLLDVIGASSRLQNGQVEFPMPAFPARTSPRDALRAMDINSGPNGGHILNREISDEIFEALYSQLIFTRLGVSRIPMAGTESMTFHRQVSGAQAYWAGAGKTVPDANPTIVGAVTLQLRELVSLSIQQNRLLRNGSPRLEQMIQDDMVEQMLRKMELAFLYGTGSVPADGSSTGAEPLGLYETTGITKTSHVSAALGPDDFIDIEGRVEDQNINYGMATGWVSHNKLRRAVKKLTDSDGNPIYSENWMELDIGGDRSRRTREMDLNGHPMITSTAIPVTTAGDVQTTDLFFGEWEHALIGMGEDIELAVDTSVHFLERQTAIQIVSETDFGVAYKEAFDITTLVKVN